MDWADDVAYSVHDMEDGFHAGLITFKNLKSPTERAELSRTTLAYCGSDVTPGELTEILDELLAQDIWPHSYDGGPAAASALKNLTSELIGRFCVAAQQATLSATLKSAPPPASATPLSHTSPIGHSFTRYAANLVVPRRQRLECALLKGITARYVMARAGAAQAQARERELLAELAHAVEHGAPSTLDPLFRPAWEQAGSAAARRRVVIDQVASLTDTSAIAWHHRLCAP
jgi:dGTPase